MRIGELSKKTDFQVETLRYYEKLGLLAPVNRTESGYREYDAESLKQLRFIKQAKYVGFSLNEISELLTLRVERDQHSCGDVKTIAEQKIEQIDNKINELDKMRKALHKITRCLLWWCRTSHIMHNFKCLRWRIGNLKND